MTAADRQSTGKAESVLALFAGPDLGVFCQSYLAHLTYHCTGDDAGSALAAAAIAAARQLHHPFSEAIALAYASLLEVFRGDSSAALERGREAVALCRKHGFVYYLAMANIVTGWADALEGNTAAGLAQLRSGLNEMKRVEAQIRMPWYLAMLAEIQGRTGAISEGLASISAGFAFAGRNHEAWAVAELYRVQGILLLASGQPEEAQNSFRQGAEAARQSGSQAFERKLSRLSAGTAKTASPERP